MHSHQKFERNESKELPSRELSTRTQLALYCVLGASIGIIPAAAAHPTEQVAADAQQAPTSVQLKTPAKQNSAPHANFFKSMGTGTHAQKRISPKQKTGKPPAG
jgi:hypothetical protein